jgi:hypothetical protein
LDLYIIAANLVMWLVVAQPIVLWTAQFQHRMPPWVALLLTATFFPGIPLTMYMRAKANREFDERESRSYDFRGFFDFLPEDFTQEDYDAVDRELRRRAEYFTAACYKQEDLRRDVKYGCANRSALEAQDVVVTQLKAEFWDAHSVAKYFDCPVQLNVASYLPNGRQPVLFNFVQREATKAIA